MGLAKKESLSQKKMAHRGSLGTSPGREETDTKIYRKRNYLQRGDEKRKSPTQKSQNNLGAALGREKVGGMDENK